MTCALSAICGTHLGDTKLRASITGSPASDSRSISSTLTAVGTASGSFCRPSRGPTSTSLHPLRAGSSQSLLFGLERDELIAFLHLLAVPRSARCATRPAMRRNDGVLHLHRLDDHQRPRPAPPPRPLDQHLDHAARHRRCQAAAGFLVLHRLELCECKTDSVRPPSETRSARWPLRTTVAWSTHRLRDPPPIALFAAQLPHVASNFVRRQLQQVARFRDSAPSPTTTRSPVQEHERCDGCPG